MSSEPKDKAPEALGYLTGFQKTLQSSIPELMRDMISRQKRLADELAICEDGIVWLRNVADAAGIEVPDDS